MAKRRGFSNKGNSVGLVFDDEMFNMLDKLKAAEKNTNDILMKAMEAAAKPIEADLLLFMARHHRTGDTAASMTQAKKELVALNTLYFATGFDLEKGGLPALFLDLGTPTIKPSYFVYYAFRKNESNMQLQAKRALEKILEELK